jgi:hypothetical protein
MQAKILILQDVGALTLKGTSKENLITKKFSQGVYVTFISRQS